MPTAPSAIAGVFRDVAEAVSKFGHHQPYLVPQNGSVSLSFSLPREDLESCLAIIRKYEKNGARILSNASLSKLTVEGAGMQRQYGVASKLFGALAARDIGIDIITTSETKISFCVDEALSDRAISAVTKAFSL
jgi:aspartokinase